MNGHIVVPAYAKLNISLDVLGRLGDGYHSMLMVMQSCSLCDDVSIELNGGGRFSAESNLPFLPKGDGNLAVHAARLFFEEAGMDGAGAEIVLTKRIPVCAGLGGGSSDAAAVLRGLNLHTGAGFGTDRLERLGARLGSDVPFCIAGGTALASGRGDVLEKLASMPDCFFVICQPKFSISTPDLFARIDKRSSRFHPDTAGITSALDNGDLTGVARRMYNVFEDVLPRRFAAISVIKSSLLELGALGAGMTGTGSAVFGLFGSREKAEEAHGVLRQKYLECHLAQPVGRLM